jgi:hypothetical protein
MPIVIACPMAASSVFAPGKAQMTFARICGLGIVAMLAAMPATAAHASKQFLLAPQGKTQGKMTGGTKGKGKGPTLGTRIIIKNDTR